MDEGTIDGPDTQPKPVCPRCLGIEPGKPGGTPDQPHPGPFTHDLCSPCAEVVEAAWRAERGRRESTYNPVESLALQGYDGNNE